MRSRVDDASPEVHQGQAEAAISRHDHARGYSRRGGGEQFGQFLISGRTLVIANGGDHGSHARPDSR